jgi:hypothetical protein
MPSVQSARWQYPVQTKIALSQLTFEKRKSILKCYWETENVTEVQRGAGEMNLELGAGGGHFEHL